MFSYKTLRAEIITEGEFFSGFNSFNISGLPMEVQISGAEPPAGIVADVKIYGVSKSHMENITTIYWLNFQAEKKSIRIFANDGDGEHLLFEGNIVNAIPEYNAAPDVYIKVHANCGSINNLATPEPYSFKGEIEISKIIEDICNSYGMGFQNNGVTGIDKNPYFNQNGLFARISAAMNKYNIGSMILNDTVIIYPRDGSAYNTWTLTNEHYIGYPSFTDIGIAIKLDKLLYNLKLGDNIVVKGSEVSAANDTWMVNGFKYNLSTKIGGQWFMEIYGSRIGGILNGQVQI